VDDAHHVITGACADFADKRDSQCLAQILELTEGNLSEHDIELGEILADGGYSSGEALAYLDAKGIRMDTQLWTVQTRTSRLYLL
jgi:hypothetical protein